MRAPSMWIAGFLGAFGGFMLAFQSSSGRLRGILPNEEEVMHQGELRGEVERVV